MTTNQPAKMQSPSAQQEKKTFNWMLYPKNIWVSGALLTLIGLVLGGFEYCSAGEENKSKVLCLIVFPWLFFLLLTALELMVLEKKRRQNSPTLIGMYLLFKGVRLLASIIAVATYVYVAANLKVTFAVNVIVFFLTALIITSIFHYIAERKTNQPK